MNGSNELRPIKALSDSTYLWTEASKRTLSQHSLNLFSTVIDDFCGFSGTNFYYDHPFVKITPCPPSIRRGRIKEIDGS